MCGSAASFANALSLYAGPQTSVIGLRAGPQDKIQFESRLRAAAQSRSDVPWLAEIQQPPVKLPADAPRLSDLLTDDSGRRITSLDGWKSKRQSLRRWWAVVAGYIAALVFFLLAAGSNLLVRSAVQNGPVAQFAAGPLFPVFAVMFVLATL